MRPTATVVAVQLCLGALLASVAAPAGPAGVASAHGGDGTENFTASGAVYTVAWAPDGKWFAAGTSSGNITLYDGTVHFEVARWHAHNGPINQVVFSPDGQRIASVSGAYRVNSTEQTLKVWNRTGTLLLNISDHYDWVTSVAWSPRGDLIASSSGVDSHEDPNKVYGEVKFWNASTGALMWNATARAPEFAENGSYPARIAWSPNGEKVVALGHLSDMWLLYPYERPLRMEQINHSYRDLIGHATHGWAVDFSPDSQLIVGGFSYDFTRPGAANAQFFPDGSTDSGPVIVFDPRVKNADGFATQIMRADVHSKPAEWVTWDTTGRYIASCSGTDLVNATGSVPRAGQDGVVDAGEIIAWDFANSTGGRLKPVNVWVFGHDWCSAVVFKPGELTVLAGTADALVKIYAFDYDGDGCMVWADAAPSDPTVCRAPTAPPSDFLGGWAPFVGLLAAVLVAAGVIAWRVRRVRPPEVPERGRNGRDRGRSGGRSRSARRR